MKKKAFKRKRNILNVLAVLVMLMAMLLTACSSGKTDAAPASEETSAVEADKEAELAEQAKEEAAEPEPTAEPTPEPTPEAVVYEGIDMESTLPGEQWVASFNGIIDEPKLVVFNDETNKKVILEEGQEVDFSLTDKIVIYIPDGHNGGYIKNKGLIFSANINYNLSGVTVLENLSSSKKVGDSVPLEVLLTYDGENMTLSATLNLVE